MNQIIVLKQKNQKQKKFFKTQFVVSLLIVFGLGFYYLRNWKKSQEMSAVSESVNQAFQLEKIYVAQKSSREAKRQNPYFGKITIPAIELEYSVFNECTDELLKILPCKFYGVEMQEKGNICIAGHNYDDNRFFGNLNKLKKGDTIYLEDLMGNKHQYRIYDKYKVAPNDFECLKAQRKYDLTLVTCDNLNDKRFVIKASR